jgi:hypothetical protein
MHVSNLRLVTDMSDELQARERLVSKACVTTSATRLTCDREDFDGMVASKVAHPLDMRCSCCSTYVTRLPSTILFACSSGSTVLSVSAAEAPVVGAFSETNRAATECLLGSVRLVGRLTGVRFVRCGGLCEGVLLA